MRVCVFASRVYPVRGEQNGGGEIGVCVDCDGIAVKPLDYIYADSDGVILSDSNLLE